MHLRTINSVFSASMLPVELVRGKGYFYYVFDDGKKYLTRSVMVMRLDQLSPADWINEGKVFARENTDA